MSIKQYDLVVFGATGFTGKLVCRYLKEKKCNNIRWAIAGRNAKKLETLKEQLQLNVDSLVADSFDIKSLESLCEKSKVVLTTVGPYLRYGESLVKACVEKNAHYCDLTGEVPFIHKTILKYHERAKKNKVKIVHSCGFDSVPSDLGNLYLQSRAKEKLDTQFKKVKYYMMDARGAFSRGTIESLMDVVALTKIPQMRKHLANVNWLTDLEPVFGVDQKKMKYDEELSTWTSPFVMETINTRIVRRSNQLLGLPWEKDWEYTECVSTGKGLRGYLGGLIVHLVITAIALSALSTFTRKIISKLLPDVGSGPSESSIEKGFFKVSIFGAETTKNNYMARVDFEGPKDPGYGSTAIMLAEAALCLSQESGTERYGVGTPASMIGLDLLPELRKNGFKIDFHAV